jgi:hypothetical protein
MSEAEDFGILVFKVGRGFFGFIYLFIRHDGMQPGGNSPFGKMDKMFRERKSEQPRSHALLPHEQVQNAKTERGTAVPSAANSNSNSLLHDAPSSVLSPSCSHGGRFPCRKDKPSWLHQISTSEVRNGGGRSKVVVVVRRIARALLAEFTQTLPLIPDACKQVPPRRVQVGCRHVGLAELSKARLRTGIRG